MITDSPLIAAKVPTPVPAPTGAYALPGIQTILNRPTPGGGPMPTQAEAVTQLTKSDYTGGLTTGNIALASETTPVQGIQWATNPRKDGTTPVIPASADVGTNALTSPTRSAYANNIALARAAKGASTGADTGNQPSGALPWAALGIIGFVALMLFKRK